MKTEQIQKRRSRAGEEEYQQPFPIEVEVGEFVLDILDKIDEVTNE